MSENSKPTTTAKMNIADRIMKLQNQRSELTGSYFRLSEEIRRSEHECETIAAAIHQIDGAMLFVQESQSDVRADIKAEKLAAKSGIPTPDNPESA